MKNESHDSTKTIPIPRMPVERKTIPVICPWCNRITLLRKWNVEEGKAVMPTHGICPKCLKKIKDRE